MVKFSYDEPLELRGRQVGPPAEDRSEGWLVALATAV